MRCVASTPALQTRQGGEVRKVCGVSPSPWKRGLTLGDLRPKFYVPSGIVWLTECEALDFSCAQHISGEEAMLHARKQEASDLKPLTADDFRDVMQSTSDLRSNFRLPCACLTSKMTFHQCGFRGVPFPSRLTFAQTIIHADVASVSAPEIFGGTLFLFGSRSSPRRSGPDLCADPWALSAFFFSTLPTAHWVPRRPAIATAASFENGRALQRQMRVGVALRARSAVGMLYAEHQCLGPLFGWFTTRSPKETDHWEIGGWFVGGTVCRLVEFQERPAQRKLALWPGYFQCC